MKVMIKKYFNRMDYESILEGLLFQVLFDK